MRAQSIQYHTALHVLLVTVGVSALRAGIRICEHRGISYRTRRQLVNPSFSIIRGHSLEHDHVHREGDFRILFMARHLSELRIAESLFIHKNRPALNNYATAIPLQLFP